MTPGGRVAWLTSEQAAQHLGFPNAKAFRKWLDRQPAHRPRRHYLGRMLRFRQVDLDACVETVPETEQLRRPA